VRFILPAALLAVVTLAGCDTAEPEAEAGAPIVAAPASPSAAAPSPAAPEGPSTSEVCMAVSKALIDGSVDIADDAVKSIDERWSTKKVNAELRASFGAMAKKVQEQADWTTDPALKASVEATAAELVEGSKTSKPGAFLNKEFQTLTKDLDKTCAN
jgi:hypothetical protein